MVRVRLAPSPTGKLHLGTARTALFNFLFARKNKGAFILRFEDTDETRSTKEYEEDIKASLKWLGLYWDEEYHQMERLARYQEYVEKLIAQGVAEKFKGAVIFRAKKALDKLGIEYKAKVKAVKNKSDELQKDKDLNAYLVENIGRDLLHGPIKGLVSDSVLLRSGNPPIPTFHLAVVVDDYEMKINYVIRGEDHLPNTPLHIVLQRLLSIPTPFYVHLPLILGPDKTKLSKRHGAVAVSDYKKAGYLPEAIVNYLALLGWSEKGKDKEILDLKELIKAFKLEDLQKSPAVFFKEKLDWLNGEWIRQLSVKELTARILDFGYKKVDERMISIIQKRLKRLDEVPYWTDFFFQNIPYKKELLKGELEEKQALEILKLALARFSKTQWKSDKIKIEATSLAQEVNLKPKDLLYPIRIAITGRSVSPPLFESMEILGKDETLKRLEKAMIMLKNSSIRKD
jgi:glutamyl-tRNA synthetase|uniref:Glutamate--tRNA ligase n=1 Tax=candidate division CPR3 bacterium TaxID=2268181 RepID=A0A7V3J9X0_UNCC3